MNKSPKGRSMQPAFKSKREIGVNTLELVIADLNNIIKVTDKKVVPIVPVEKQGSEGMDPS